jgi:hypothetical protein
MRALSIRQPWAWLIVHGHKPVENRDWATDFRGPLLIHASKTLLVPEFEEQCQQVLDWFGIDVPADVPRGGIVGMANVTDCVQELDSLWFTGPCGLLLADAKPLPFAPWKGQLGFFHVPAYAVGLRLD